MGKRTPNVFKKEVLDLKVPSPATVMIACGELAQVAKRGGWTLNDLKSEIEDYWRATTEDQNITVLHEPAVYPGHPVTLAWLIVNHFPSLDQALDREDGTPKALSDSAIPGAGGCVYSALDLLGYLKNKTFPTWEEAIAWADSTWANCDSQADGGCRGPEGKQYYLDRYRAGQAQADRIKEQFKSKVFEWLSQEAATT